jgi:hypothetical protein
MLPSTICGRDGTQEPLRSGEETLHCAAKQQEQEQDR